jgi:uncharacterized protein YecT (DUF1311 family)
MHIYFLLAILVFAFSQPAGAHTPEIPGCKDATTTFALTQCRGNQIGEADAKLQKYLVAARKQVVLSELNPSVIDAEQAAWEAYRTTHCGNLYLYWVTGTIRYEMFGICMLKLTNDRTVDVWRAYLTYLDSTPPVLPDPSQ